MRMTEESHQQIEASIDHGIYDTDRPIWSPHGSATSAFLTAVWITAVDQQPICGAFDKVVVAAQEGLSGRGSQLGPDEERHRLAAQAE